MASLLYRLGAFSAKRHWIVIAAWVLIFAGITAWSAGVGKHYSSAFTVPNTESQKALDMLQQRFPASTGSTVHVIFTSADNDITDEQSTFADAATQFAAIDGVTSVTNPFTAKSQINQISTDGSGAFLTVHLDENTPTATKSGNQTATSKKILKIGDSFATDQLSVAYTGIPDAKVAAVNTDLIGVGVALVVLLVTFGSLLAAGMPIITAAIGVSVSGSLLAIASHYTQLSSTTPLLGSMLGLAVGIDYSLFIVSRHRSHLANGMAPQQSVAVATATAGTAVLSAGLTVIIALLGLFIVGIPFLGMMGMGAALSVVLAMAAALTLIPALLGAFGKALIPRKNSRAYRREQPDVPATGGARWGKFVTAKPVVTVLLVLGFLVALALPASGLRLTLPGVGYNPEGSISRTGFDTMASDFGPGVNGPLMIVSDISHTDPTEIETVLNTLHDAFANEKGVSSVSPAVPNPGLDTAALEIIPTSGPTSVETEQLVDRLRAQAPAFKKANGFSFAVTGNTAVAIDISNLLERAILPFGVVVVGLSLLLLMVAFRSLAVPLTATLGFLLSVAATFGVTVMIFIWGWGAEFFGVTKVGPVVSFMPILVMAVLFGLAMDYQVFLVSRMRERFAVTQDARASVVSGFAASARVVTAAALIMFSVFFSFVPGSQALLQPVALALAVGVAIDAFIVRMTLIPAVMSLLGRYAWALPRSLEKRLPDMDIEGERVHGRLATLQWQQELNTDVVVQAENVTVTHTEFAPLSFTALRGEVLALVTDDPTAELILGVVSGRSDARGLLISCGRPLPFDGYHVRREAALVLSVPAPSGLSLEQYIFDGLRLNHLHRDDDAIDSVVASAQMLAEAGGMRLDHARLSRPVSAMNTEEVWLIDLAIAVMAPVKLLAVDLRNAPPAAQSDLMWAVAKELAPSTTFTCLVASAAEDGVRAAEVQGELRTLQVVHPTRREAPTRETGARR